MQKSDKRKDAIKETITDYVYTVRVEGGTPVETTHSETCFDVTGYTRQEFIDNPYLWILMVVEEDHPLVKQQSEQVLARHYPLPIKHRITHKNGSIRWVESSIIPNHNPEGELTSYYGLIRDITTHKDMADQLSTIDKLISQADTLLHKNNNNRTPKIEVQSLDRKDAEKRIYKRVSTGNDCWAELSDSGKIKLKDISITGICLKTSEPLPVDSWHQIKILSEQEEEINSTGKVIWSDPSVKKDNGYLYYESGLKITGMNDRLKSSLGRFIINITN